MRTRTRHLVWLVVLVALGLSGCYRSVGGSLEPTPSNREIAQVNTPLPSFSPQDAAPTLEEMTDLPGPAATLTPFPTLPPASDTPEPTATWTRVPPDGQGGLAEPTSTWTPMVVVMAPSFTPLPTETEVPPATATPQPTNTNPPPPTATPQPTNTNPPPPTQAQPVAVAMVPSFTPPPSLAPQLQASVTFTPYPFNTLPPTATYTPFMPPGSTLAPSPTIPVGEAQPLGERPTETLPAPAATEPFDQGGVAVAQLPTLNPNQMSATAIIYGATLTQAAILGIAMPTFTLMPGQVVGPTPIPAGQVVIYITATPSVAGGICSQHLIQPNETLSRIALQYGVTSQQIAQANAITNPDLIQMGKTLNIPCPVAPTATPLGSLATPAAGQGGLGAGNIYIVQAGDNIYRLSLQFGVSMLDLMNANGMGVADAQMIYVGQQLIIPASATVPVATLAPGQTTPVYIVITNTPAVVQPAPAG